MVKDDAADVFLRRAALADWHRFEEKIPELQINWSGSLKFGDKSVVAMHDETHLRRAEIAKLEPALVNPPEQTQYAPKEGAIDRFEATRILVEKACEKGAVLQAKTIVTGFYMMRSKVMGGLTSRGRLDAYCVVLACGTGISALTERVGTPVPVLSSPAILLRFAVAATLKPVTCNRPGRHTLSSATTKACKIRYLHRRVSTTCSLPYVLANAGGISSQADIPSDGWHLPGEVRYR